MQIVLAKRSDRALIISAAKKRGRDMSVQFSIGIRDGKAIHIDEISPDRNGLDCGCVCPECERRLIAYTKGKKQRPHFRHETDCDCTGARESALHLLAKQIIEESREIMLPGWEITRNDLLALEHKQSVAWNVEIDLPENSAIEKSYDFIRSEKTIEGGSRRPDVEITIQGKACAIEIAVTHFVDEAKRAEIESLRIPMFEIDLSEFSKKNHTREEIVKAVLKTENNRKWIYNQKYQENLDKKKKEFAEKYTEEEQRQAREEKRRIQREREKQAWREKCINELKRSMEPERYRQEVMALKDDRAAFRWLKSDRDFSNLNAFPFYMNIPITGEFVFSCDRRIWQSKLFKNYVVWGFGKDYTEFNVSKIRDYIFSDKMPIPVRYDKKKAYRVNTEIDGMERSLSLTYDVIKRYFDYLTILGFTGFYSYYNICSSRPESLKPPNDTVAEALRSAINSVDSYNPNVDWMIEKELRLRLPDNELWNHRYLSWNSKNDSLSYD